MINFQIEKFSGPLDLLLQLIEKEEMDITEISLAAIADQYVAYVEQAENIDPEEIADFLVIAAKLLYIKSKALLPYLSKEEEEKEIIDLERQLKMYKEFVEASFKIANLIRRNQQSFIPDFNKLKRRNFIIETKTFSPPEKINIIDLKNVWLQVLLRFKKREQKLPEIRLEPKISLDERIAYIRTLLREQLSLNFQHLLKKAKTKTEIIVSILAVLELAKQKELIFEQEELFSEIKILKI